MRRKVITSATAAAPVGRRRRGAALLPMALLILALIAPAASAHTSALCALTAHTARCMGTVANRPVTLGPASGRMTLNSGGYGRLYLTVAPMLSLFTPPMTIAAKLICADQTGGPICIGTAKVSRNKILITTTGRPGHGTVVIRLSDAVTNPSGSDQRPTH